MTPHQFHIGQTVFLRPSAFTLPVSEVVQHPLASTHVIGSQAGSPVAPAP